MNILNNKKNVKVISRYMEKNSDFKKNKKNNSTGII